MGNPNPGHLFRLALIVLFIGLLGVRISVELLDSSRDTMRARDAMDATPAKTWRYIDGVVDVEKDLEPKA